MSDWRGYTFDKTCSYTEYRGYGRHFWEPIKQPQSQKIAQVFLTVQIKGSISSSSPAVISAWNSLLAWSLAQSISLEAKRLNMMLLTNMRLPRQVERTSGRDVQTSPRWLEIKKKKKKSKRILPNLLSTEAEEASEFTCLSHTANWRENWHCPSGFPFHGAWLSPCNNIWDWIQVDSNYVSVWVSLLPPKFIGWSLDPQYHKIQSYW